MNIIVSHNQLLKFLATEATPDQIANLLTLCGPTVDKLEKTKNDYLFHIEVITNRIDYVSVMGVAREANAILNQHNIKSSLKIDPYLQSISKHTHSTKLNIKPAQDLCARFMAVSIEAVKVKPSPLQIADLLNSIGQRPINNLVDITNELTFLYGMPLHVFDQDKLGMQELTIRLSQKNEKLTTLDGQENHLQGNDIVITDGTGKLVDLCGIMGGNVAEVDEHTTNVLLIVPVYDSKRIRRSSLYLQKRTLASQIYEKKPDPAICHYVLDQAISLINQRAGGEISSAIFDYYPDPYKKISINLQANFISQYACLPLSSEESISILNNLGIHSSTKANQDLICEIPSWRQNDLSIKEDIVEEVARIYGYFKIEPQLLSCLPTPPEVNPLTTLEKKIRHFIYPQGFAEVYNNSLISESLITKTKLKTTDHLRLKNALTQDAEYLRVSLAPSLLQNFKNNSNHTESPINIFEIANTYLKTPKVIEKSTLGIISNQSFFNLKGQIESLLQELKIEDLSFKPLKTHPSYLSSNSIGIFSKNTVVGYIGIPKNSVLVAFGIEEQPCLVEIDCEELQNRTKSKEAYKPVSEYPTVNEDVTITSKLPVGEIISVISSISSLIKNVDYIKSFNSNHTFRIVYQSDKGNLSSEDIKPLREKILKIFV